ncbi:YicC/YloC family endoribonuclease [Desulfovibrio cuneatus]|uniref:YicC/YloC family endoribonuclease n=1 Tax=Desulfovibrio cuneatus TaxID=159728 RepID=UPI0004290BC8|nr:YicC/YloC family endoribonuclease [Desulfovibrio cuneatus]
MLHSMTGFGRSLLEEERWTQVWEIRSVNGRHLDIRWRLPYEARAFEGLFEKKVKTFACRGRLEISLHMQRHRQDGMYARFNEGQADAMLEAVAAFAASRGDEFVPDYNRFLSQTSFWEDSSQDMEDDLAQSLEAGLAAALEDWNEARITEGRALERDLLMRLAHMEEWAQRIEARAPAIKEERFALVRDRVGDILASLGQELDEGRFLQEVVLLADKMDVTEELTRLRAHFARLHELVPLGRDAGRKLDFTLQECFREVSTCGNKVQDMHVSRLVVDLKNELEKCREQVQNVE